MATSVEEILKDYEFSPDGVQRISYSTAKPKLEIVEPDPSWPHKFEQLRSRILSALGPSVALAIGHTGSTSVPGLPAKPVIDIDLTVADVGDEASYAPQLEAAGFGLRLREPAWHGHRYFSLYEPGAGLASNLHVWGPGSPEVERHRIFRAWLLKSDEDRLLYAQTKKDAAALSAERDETVMEYNMRKQDVIREILWRAFKDLGYVE